jgi:uncharacterized repeat protein (TIGR03803 family)
MKNLGFGSIACIIAVFCVATVVASHAQTLTTLVDFNGANGSSPSGEFPLVQGTDGNLYGITYYGGTGANCFNGSEGCGTFFKMSPSGELTTLYNFCSLSKCSDGAGPESLIQASDGNFYGVTFLGGCDPDNECGTIFEVTPSGTLTTLYDFCQLSECADGQEPTALVQATNGNFYGTTWYGGTHRLGSVFELTSTGKLTTLHNYCAKTGCPDGSTPSSLIQASNGNFYGSTGDHTIFEMTPAGKLTTVFTFKHGASNALIQTANGDFYGTTDTGGSGDRGIVFGMTPAGKLKTLHSFCPANCATGDSPLSGLTQGSDGNFYGTTYLAGNTSNAGSVYEITPTGTFTTLYLFCSETNCADGEGGGALMQYTNGDFYGTTGGGGTGTEGSGTVFSLSTGLAPFVAARPGFGPASQSVTILGNGLTGTTSVTFSGVAATFTVVSDTYIQAQVPSGATTGTIAVTTPGGTLSSNVAFQVLQ